MRGDSQKMEKFKISEVAKNCQNMKLFWNFEVYRKNNTLQIVHSVLKFIHQKQTDGFAEGIFARGEDSGRPTREGGRWAADEPKSKKQTASQAFAV